MMECPHCRLGRRIVAKLAEETTPDDRLHVLCAGLADVLVCDYLHDDIEAAYQQIGDRLQRMVDSRVTALNEALEARKTMQ